MKIKVVSEFYDKFHTSTLFPVGAVVDFEDARAKDIIQRKLGVLYVEPKVEQKPAPAPEPKTEEAALEVESKTEEVVDTKVQDVVEAKAEEKTRGRRVRK